MKKLRVFLVSILLLSMFSATVYAGGDLTWFTIDGFDYTFSYGDMSGNWATSENSSLKLTGYNGNKLIDTATFTKDIPKGLYVRDMIKTGKLESDIWRDWDARKDDYVEINWKWSTLYFYNSNESVKVMVLNRDGIKEELKFDDQKPIVINNRTLLPIRAIAEYYDWNVNWDEEGQQVIIENDLKKMRIKLFNTGVYVYTNGSKYYSHVDLDVPAMALNGRTLLPIRAVAEAMDLTVEWDQENGCVVLKQ